MGGPVEIAIAVVQRQSARGDEFLIGLRPEGAPLAGYWEFPGGKVQPGEDAAAAAVRECQEETGLAVRVLREYPEVEHSYAHADLRLRFFACALASESAEAGARAGDARFCWVLRSELANYTFPPANDALLARLQSPAC